MISNLVDNAIRYTSPNGTVEVAVRHSKHGATIDVIDNGPGIPPEERMRVFDRFYRRQSTGGTGSGLGLAIVKSALTRHGGTVTLDDTTTGKGLRVSIDLPLHFRVSP
jgi:signal transduction histidine kinase